MLFNSSWTLCEQRTMESVVPASSGFHRDLTHLIMIMERSLSMVQFVKTISMNRFYDEALLGVPGSLANVKDKFFHRRAGKNVKVSFVFKFHLCCYLSSLLGLLCML